MDGLEGGCKLSSHVMIYPQCVADQWPGASARCLLGLETCRGLCVVCVCVCIYVFRSQRARVRLCVLMYEIKSRDRYVYIYI